MTAASEPLDDEVARLRGCLNDLVGITALPALWSGAEPPRVVGTLLDAFAYVRLADDPDGEPGLEAARGDATGASTASALGATLAQQLGTDPASWGTTPRLTIGGARFSKDHTRE